MERLTRLLASTVDRAGPGRILVVLGVVLLLNPLYVGALYLDEPNWYRYDAAEVRFENGTVTGPGVASVDDDDVACLDRAYRNCALEHHVLTADDVALPSPTFMARNGGYGHNYVFTDGQFYRTEIEERNGTKYLALERLDSGTAIGFASTPLTDTPDVVREAVEGDTVTTRDPIPSAGDLVRDPETGQLYVLYLEASHSLGSESSERAKSEGRIVETALTVFLGLTGLAAILRGQRIRIER